jgi:hypothetical protein
VKRFRDWRRPTTHGRSELEMFVDKRVGLPPG